jgi:hypothetical protein
MGFGFSDVDPLQSIFNSISAFVRYFSKKQYLFFVLLTCFLFMIGAGRAAAGAEDPRGSARRQSDGFPHK